MLVAVHDHTVATDLTLKAYQRAREPKRLVMTNGDHLVPPWVNSIASRTAIDRFKAHF